MVTDLEAMRRALQLAARARGHTSPNPMVGAVIVSGGRIVGEGYHHRAGEPHAEVHALREAGRRARGSALYVTLEPCAHYGRTPPCTDAIIAAGVSRVIAAGRDPSPKVNGKGFRLLREAGLAVEAGLLAEEAARLNEFYFTFVRAGRPFVSLKLALSLDGKIATASGESRCITGPAARRFVHRLRSWHDAVMVGIGTALADDPRLTVRHVRSRRQPRRVIVDSRLRLPATARVLKGDPPPIIITTDKAPATRARRLEATGAEIVSTPVRDGRVDPAAALKELGRRSITSVLLEGGAELAAAALAAGVVDKLYFFLAPRLIGGASSPGAIGGAGIARLSDAVRLTDVRVRRVGEDLLVEAYPVRKAGRR